MYVRDESFINSWGAGYIRGGGRKFFWLCTGGGIKLPMGRRGSCISSGIGEGGAVRCVPDPPISQLYNVRPSEPLGDIGNKVCPILVKQ